MARRTRATPPPPSPNSVLRQESTFTEDAKSVYTWFANLMMPTLKGRPACKPTMPAVIPMVIENLKEVMGSQDGKSDWTFVDL